LGGELRREETSSATIIKMTTPNSNHQKITTQPLSFHLPQKNPNQRKETNKGDQSPSPPKHLAHKINQNLTIKSIKT
jgi:hypothetical protein